MRTAKTLLIVLAAIGTFALVYTLQTDNTTNKNSTITVGAIFPLSGGPARYGELEKKGLELAKDKINQNGGVKGKRLKIVYQDSKGKPKQGVSAWHQLTNTYNIPVMLSSISSVCQAVAPLANRDKITLVSTDCVTSEYSSPNDYTFRVISGSTREGKEMAQYLDQKGEEKVAILQINNAYGEGVASSFKQNFKDIDQKNEITSHQTFSSGQADFQTSLTKIKTSNPDAIYLISYAAEAENILQEQKELGLEAQIYAAQPFEDRTLLENVPGLAEEVIYMTPNIRTDEGEKFIEKYKKEYGEKPRVNAVRTYDALHIIAKAMRQCEEITSDCIKQKLYDIEYKGGVGTLDFDKNGDVDLPYVIKTVKDGEFVRVK